MLTELEMRLYPVRELYAGDLFFPTARTAELLHAWHEWTGTVPDEITSMVHLVRLPPQPQIPEPLRGQAFAVVEAAYLGDAGTGAELIGPLRRLGPDRDTFAMIPPTALGQLNMDPDEPAPLQGDSRFLADLPAAAIDALTDAAGSVAGAPLASIEASHMIFSAGLVPTPELAAAVREQVQAVKDALAPWRARYDYYNFAETPAAASAVLPPASYQRLQKIKTSYDPDQVIISTHPVWLAQP